jgi:hypothetical protein
MMGRSYCFRKFCRLASFVEGKEADRWCMLVAACIRAWRGIGEKVVEDMVWKTVIGRYSLTVSKRRA